MSLTFKMKCADQEQEITIDDDGVLEMPGYDPQYEEAMLEFSGGGKYKMSVCYYLYKSWEELSEEFHDKITREMREPRYEYVRDRGRMWGEREVVRKFNYEDLARVLAEVLQQYVKAEDYNAIAIANVIGGMNLNLNECPDIEVSGSEHGEWPETVYRYETHQLKIGDLEIVNWSRVSERRIYGIMYFDTEVEDLAGEIEDAYPSDFIVEVLDALGMKDPDPGPPDEFDTPKPDDTKKGSYGVMYEELIYDRNKRPADRNVQSVEVVIYDSERLAKEAAELSEKLMRNWDQEYLVTVVRRMSPSEREEQKQLATERKALRKQYQLFKVGAEEVPEPDPVYTQWTELEDDPDDRPEDFED